jgi:hypothetical protein
MGRRRARGLLTWALLPLALLEAMALRRLSSARLALHSLATWSVMAAGMVVGFFRGGAAAAAPVREVAC